MFDDKLYGRSWHNTRPFWNSSNCRNCSLGKSLQSLKSSIFFHPLLDGWTWESCHFWSPTHLRKLEFPVTPNFDDFFRTQIASLRFKSSDFQDSSSRLMFFFRMPLKPQVKHTYFWSLQKPPINIEKIYYIYIHILGYIFHTTWKTVVSLCHHFF